MGNNPVQNVADENNGKSFNLALCACPEAVRGLQIGFSGYHDNLTPLGAPNVRETILAAHVVYQRARFEFLNEAVLLRHSSAGSSPSVNTLGFYTQISRQFGSYRPYFRCQYVNVPDRDPLFPDVHLQEGPSFGLRYNVGEFVGLKLQYDRTLRRQLPAFNTLNLQMSFTF